MFALDWELLTWTGDIKQLKGHFKDVLNPSTMSIFEVVEPEDSEENKIITVTKVIMVVKKLFCGRVIRMNEICPEML